jgi:hypothetical protein
MKTTESTERQKLADKAVKALKRLAEALENDGKVHGASQVKNMIITAHQWGYCE